MAGGEPQSSGGRGGAPVRHQMAGGGCGRGGAPVIRWQLGDVAGWETIVWGSAGGEPSQCVWGGGGGGGASEEGSA